MSPLGRIAARFKDFSLALSGVRVGFVGADGYCACGHTPFPSELIEENPERILSMASSTEPIHVWM
jgi:hypothetical protein